MWQLLMYVVNLLCAKIMYIAISFLYTCVYDNYVICVIKFERERQIVVMFKHTPYI